MIQQFDTTIGECFYIGNESVSCILCVHCGQIELLHFGAPLLPEDAEALSAELLQAAGGKASVKSIDKKKEKKNIKY